MTKNNNMVLCRDCGTIVDTPSNRTQHPICYNHYQITCPECGAVGEYGYDRHHNKQIEKNAEQFALLSESGARTLRKNKGMI